jgi:hypothetical protein
VDCTRGKAIAVAGEGSCTKSERLRARTLRTGSDPVGSAGIAHGARESFPDQKPGAMPQDRKVILCTIVTNSMRSKGSVNAI